MCVHLLEFFIQPSYYCLRADDSWRPAPGKWALASIWVSIQSFQSGRRWEQAQLLNLSRAYLERIHTHLVELPNTPVCAIRRLLQGNVRPYSLRRAALHKTEKGGCLKGRDGIGVKEFAAWVDQSCSYLCLWHTISPMEHIILLDLPNICQFCVTGVSFSRAKFLNRTLPSLPVSRTSAAKSRPQQIVPMLLNDKAKIKTMTKQTNKPNTLLKGKKPQQT